MDKLIETDKGETAMLIYLVHENRQKLNEIIDWINETEKDFRFKGINEKWTHLYTNPPECICDGTSKDADCPVHNPDRG